MKYERLTEEVRQQLRENTLLTIEQEHFANELALKRAEAIGDESQVGAFRAGLASLEIQHRALSS